MTLKEINNYYQLVVSDKKMKQSQTKWGQTFR